MPALKSSFSARVTSAPPCHGRSRLYSRAQRAPYHSCASVYPVSACESDSVDVIPNGGNGVSVRPVSQVWVRSPVVSVSSGEALALASSVRVAAGPADRVTAFSRVNPPVVDRENASVTTTGELTFGTVTRCPPAALSDPPWSRRLRSTLVFAYKRSAST